MKPLKDFKHRSDVIQFKFIFCKEQILRVNKNRATKKDSIAVALTQVMAWMRLAMNQTLFVIKCGYILYIILKSIEFADGLDTEFERKRGI